MPTINKLQDLINQLKTISSKKIIFVAPNIHDMLKQYVEVAQCTANIDLISKFTIRIDGTLKDNEWYVNESEYDFAISVLESKKIAIKGLIDHAEKNPTEDINTSGYWKRFSELNNAIQLLYRHQKNNQLKLNQNE